MPSRPYPWTVTTTRTWSRNVRSAGEASPFTERGREVRRVGLGVGDDVQRGAGGIGGGDGDAVGLAFERAAVERHEPERAAQLDPLDGARLGQRPPEPGRARVRITRCSRRPSCHRYCPVVLVWMDLEMTGLDHLHDVIVEIATIVTDDELEIVAEGPDIVVHQDDDVLARMDPFVVEMHTRSGLLEAIRASTTSLEDAGAQTLAFIRAARPGAANGAAVRQLDRHRPPLPRRLPPGHRGAPALPLDRRVQHQGARPALVPEGAPGPPAEGRQPPRPRRHPRLHRGAALLPRAGLRARRHRRQRRRAPDAGGRARRLRRSRGAAGAPTSTHRCPGPRICSSTCTTPPSTAPT